MLKMAKRIGSTKTFKSGELAEILGVTVQSISNFRSEGMPYHSHDGVGYIYSFIAIKWFIMFKGQDIYENRRYKRIRKRILILRSKNKAIYEMVNAENSPLSKSDIEEYVKEYNKNKENIQYWYNRL